MIIARTPVRISFVGGGTDLPVFYENYGGLVISASINKYFYTILTERADSCIQVISSDLRKMVELEGLDFDDDDIIKYELDIPFAVLKYYGMSRGVNLFLASEIPPGTGLGSSASVCVNLVKILARFLDISISRYELAEKSFHIVSHILKRPIGKQDEYAVAFGGLNIIKFDPAGYVDVEAIQLESEIIAHLEESLLLYFTGISHNSNDILSEQKEKSEAGNISTISILSDIMGLVGPAREAILKGKLEEFGRLLDEGWKLKRRISDKISNKHIDAIYDIARNNGAGGGKITGAGGGGFLLLYAPPERQSKLREAMGRTGLREMRFQFDHQGSQIVYDDPFFGSSGDGSMLWRLELINRKSG